MFCNPSFDTNDTYGPVSGNAYMLFLCILQSTWHFSLSRKNCFCLGGSKVCWRHMLYTYFGLHIFFSQTVLWHYKYVCDLSIHWTGNFYYNTIQYDCPHKLWTCLFTVSHLTHKNGTSCLSSLPYLHFLLHNPRLSYTHSFCIHSYYLYYFYLHGQWLVHNGPPAVV